MYDTKSKIIIQGNVYCGLQVVMGFIYCIGHFDGGMLKIGEDAHVWGKKVYGKSLYMSLNFARNLKLLEEYSLKNKSH